MITSYTSKRRNTSTLCVRIDSELVNRLFEYDDLNPNFNKARYIENVLADFFKDETYLDMRENELKKELKEIKKEKKVYKELKERAQNELKKFKMKDIDEIKKNLTDTEKIWWMDTIKTIDRDVNFTKGRYDWYKNEYDRNATINLFLFRLGLMRELLKQEKTIKKV